MFRAGDIHKKVTYPLRFCNLNSPCMRISTHIDVYEPSKDDYWLFIAKLDDICLVIAFATTILTSCHAKA